MDVIVLALLVSLASVAGAVLSAMLGRGPP